jgi:cell division protein ZapA (FtsZ GTPase activity inhibitor)
LADNEKSLAQEYKDLNVKINKLKNEIKSLNKKNLVQGVNLDDEINAKESELSSLESKRKENREKSKSKVETLQTESKTKKSESKVAALESEIARATQPGAKLPAVPGQRGPGGLVTKQYVDDLRSQVSTLKGETPVEEEVKADAGFEQPLKTVSSDAGGGIRSKDYLYSTIIAGIDVSADIDPARQAERKVLPGSQDGVFTINDPNFVGGEYLFLGTAGTAETFSKPIGYEQFEYGLYKMAPEEVISYKKALGYSNPTSVVDKKFKDDMLQAARTVSELNYGNAVAGKRVQASLEGYLSTPQKYGFAATGVKAGPSAQDIKVKADAIRIYATDLGVGLDDAAVNKLAREWAAGNFDTTTIKPQIARSGKIDFTKGSAAEQLNTLKELAGSYGMQYDQGWYNTAATNVLTGKDDIETYKQYVKEQAKSKFPTLVAQLDQGFTVRQLASPYIQTMSNILEIDPNTIGLNDVYVNQALTGLNAEGKPSTKPLWQFEQDLRKDPRWNFTKNAQDSLMNTTRKVLQDFGLVS